MQVFYSLETELTDLLTPYTFSLLYHRYCSVVVFLQNSCSYDIQPHLVKKEISSKASLSLAKVQSDFVSVPYVEDSRQNKLF